ncbi:hypothetical protein AB0H18_47390 [Streptomyces sp. NPDC020766]
MTRTDPRGGTFISRSSCLSLSTDVRSAGGTRGDEQVVAARSAGHTPAR